MHQLKVVSEREHLKSKEEEYWLAMTKASWDHDIKTVQKCFFAIRAIQKKISIEV